MKKQTQLLDQLDKITLRTGDTFHHFVRACKALSIDLIPTYEISVRFIPTDAMMSSVLALFDIDPNPHSIDRKLAMFLDWVKLTEVDQRDLRTSDEGTPVQLSNFKPDIASFHREYLAFWLLEQSMNGWTLDKLPVIDERQSMTIKVDGKTKVVFFWGIQGILSTDSVTERLFAGREKPT